MNPQTSFVDNIEQLTIKNRNFRQVIFTAPHSQLVLMSLLPGEDIGMESHPKNDQFFRFEVGTGKVVVSGREYAVTDGSAVIVPAGLLHNIINTGKEPLKLYTIYSPAHHIEGRIHPTKTDAVNDSEDEDFGDK